MNNQVTITAAIQSASIEQMLLAYKSYSGMPLLLLMSSLSSSPFRLRSGRLSYSINVLVIIRYRDLLLYLSTK